MNVNEFKAWISGFTSVRKATPPDHDQWQEILKLIENLKDPTTHIPSNWPTADTVTIPATPIDASLVSYTDGGKDDMRDVPHHVHGGIADPYSTKEHTTGVGSALADEGLDQKTNTKQEIEDRKYGDWTKNNSGI